MSIDSGAGDGALVAMTAGDEVDRVTAFQRCYAEIERDLRAFVGAAVRDPHLRDDVVQNTAMVCWRKFAEYDPSRSFRAWARGIARYEILKARERSGAQPLILEPEAVDQLLAAFASTDELALRRARALERCLAALQPRTRGLMAQRYVENRPLEAIAELLGRSYDSVAKALSRARQQLRACIERQLQRAEARG